MKALNFIPVVVFLLCSCGESVFIKHTLKAEKMGNCTTVNTAVKMESNINGERYIFEECLPDNFNEQQCTVKQVGDSVLVSFPEKAPQNSLYRLTLDVETNPPYHHIVLGTHDAIIIVPATKF